MKGKMETGLIVRKDDVFSKIRRRLFTLFYPKEAKMLKKIGEIERPRNVVTGKVIIPREIKITREEWWFI